MGLLDNFAKRVVGEVVKLNLPQGAVTNENWQTTIGQAYGNAAPLPRNPLLPSVPFAPGQPLIPGAINPVREDGRPDPRRYEYLVAQNINITETRLVPFKTLRAAADQIDILRRCIEVLKHKMAGLDWDIVLAEDAVEQVIAEEGMGESNVRAMQAVKAKYTDEINRLRQFWETPDIANGLVFADWLNMFLEDHLVLDAVAVWPQKTVGGDLLGLQLLDGSTIKPLIDDRGMRPLPPFPAFQQILYGFPRSEFSAPTETQETDGEFTSDELSYFIRNRRTTTVYGYGPVERALTLAALYLRRQQWLQAEYTDGVLPELMFTTDATFGNNPQLLAAYEEVFNDDLSGQTAQRKRARLLPAGIEPVQFEGYGERFKDTLDEYLVNSICGHFGVQPSEIGFNPKGGLGGAGFQAGQAESSEVAGLLPLAQWVGRQLTQLSYVYLGMPRVLEFKFMPSGRQDSLVEAQRIDIEQKGGRLTLNEARSKQGLPLLDSPIADMPLMHTATGVWIVTPDGLVPADTPILPDGTVPEAISEPVPPEPTAQTIDQSGEEVGTDGVEEGQAQDSGVPGDATAEVKAFLKWAKRPRKRDFEFKHLEPVYAEVLNKFVQSGDPEGAAWYAELYLGV